MKNFNTFKPCLLKALVVVCFLFIAQYTFSQKGAFQIQHYARHIENDRYQLCVSVFVPLNDKYLKEVFYFEQLNIPASDVKFVYRKLHRKAKMFIRTKHKKG